MAKQTKKPKVVIEGLEELSVIEGTCQHLKLMSTGETKAFKTVRNELGVLNTAVKLFLSDKELKSDILEMNDSDMKDEVKEFADSARAAGVNEGELMAFIKLLKNAAVKLEDN